MVSSDIIKLHLFRMNTRKYRRIAEETIPDIDLFKIVRSFTGTSITSVTDFDMGYISIAQFSLDMKPYRV
jgi:hypothetical protein